MAHTLAINVWTGSGSDGRCGVTGWLAARRRRSMPPALRCSSASSAAAMPLAWASSRCGLAKRIHTDLVRIAWCNPSRMDMASVLGGVAVESLAVDFDGGIIFDLEGVAWLALQA